MVSANRRIYRIGEMADKLPMWELTNFYREVFTVLVNGKVSPFQADQIQRIYERLEKQSRGNGK